MYFVSGKTGNLRFTGPTSRDWTCHARPWLFASSPTPRPLLFASCASARPQVDAGIRRCWLFTRMACSEYATRDPLIQTPSLVRTADTRLHEVPRARYLFSSLRCQHVPRCLYIAVSSFVLTCLISLMSHVYKELLLPDEETWSTGLGKDHVGDKFWT